jgi:hypothetical protein
MVAALQQAVAVGRDEGEDVYLGPRHGVDDERRRFRCEPAQAAFLPAADDPPHRFVVLDGGAGGREREPAAGALAAPRDRPDGRGAAPGAERRDDRGQPVPAAVAELRPGIAAGKTALREEKVEQAPTLAGKS